MSWCTVTFPTTLVAAGGLPLVGEADVKRPTGEVPGFEHVTPSPGADRAPQALRAG